MANQLFYKAYFKHSLGVDWILPEAQISLTPEQSAPFIFVVPQKYQGTSIEKMVERMIIAIKQTPENVKTLFVSNESQWQNSVGEMAVAKRILIFGDELLKGKLGLWTSLTHHQVMLTHNLAAIKQQPAIKKQAWNHLQTFVGMS